MSGTGGCWTIRHVFRHSYTFDLRWEKMRGLALHCVGTLAAVQDSLAAFLEQGQRG
ncbi:MAG: hypothetical protein KKI08_14280 [Armatimonadetes bacterium]|nr:hypothetical protein [Armatimonadota bacterium]